MTLLNYYGIDGARLAAECVKTHACAWGIISLDML
jgi:hypothetical protein